MRTINLNRNDGGLIQGTTGEEIPGRFTPEAKNVEITTQGLITLPRRGYRPFLPFSLQVNKAITGMWIHRRKDGTGIMIAACGDAIYEILANRTTTELANGLAGEGFRWHGLTFKGKLFLANGYNPPKIYNTTLSDMKGEEDAALPSTWTARNYPSHFGLISLGGNQHLAAWGMREDPSRVRFSAADTYLDFTTEEDAFSLVPLEDNGESLRAVFSFKQFVVCLKDKTGVVYYGVDPSNLIVMDSTEIPFGAVSYESVIQLQDEVWWISQEGPISMKSVLAHSGVAAEYSTHRIPDVVEEISPNFAHKTVGFNDRSNKRLRWLIPTRRDPEIYMLLDYYYDRQIKDQQGFTQGAWMWGYGIKANCAVVYKTAGPNVVLLGGFDGNIYQANYTYQDDGVDIESYYKFPIIEPGVKIRFNEIDIEPEDGGSNCKALLHYDGKSTTVASDLTPDVERNTVKRIVPFGYGHNGQLEIRHKGGSTPTNIRSVRLRVSPEDVR